jgi:hypothetical protein
MIVFTEMSPPINLLQIEEIEIMLGFSLPYIYKNHLLQYNGGRCSPNVFSFQERNRLTNSCIHYFLAINGLQYNDMKKEIEFYKIEDKHLPTHIVPIAYDPGGNLVCISCGVADMGYIYFWDHEREVNYLISDDNDYSNIYLIAKNFDEFLNGLRYE